MKAISVNFRQFFFIKITVMVMNLWVNLPGKSVAEMQSTEGIIQSSVQRSVITATTMRSIDINSTATTRMRSIRTTTPFSLPWQYVNGNMILAYAPPILIVFATIGNTLSVIVLQNPAFRKSSTSFILSALAFVDSLVVNVGLMRQWIYFMFDIDVRNFSSFGCKLHIFLVYYLKQVCSHFIVDLLNTLLAKSSSTVNSQ
jgi:hypothetical protein